jgi:hypothetical protein
MKNDSTPSEGVANNADKEEWGGWKIVSEMLDNPYSDGIYPTSWCYQKLYEFVLEQKAKARQETRQEIKEWVESYNKRSDGINKSDLLKELEEE